MSVTREVSKKLVCYCKIPDCKNKVSIPYSNKLEERVVIKTLCSQGWTFDSNEKGDVTDCTCPNHLSK